MEVFAHGKTVSDVVMIVKSMIDVERKTTILPFVKK